MDVFYALNPKLMERYQPYMHSALKQSRTGVSEAGWTNGLYVAKAISAFMSKNAKYPSEPERLWIEPGEEYGENGEPITDTDRFEAFAIAFNAGIKRKSGTSNADIEQ